MLCKQVGFCPFRGPDASLTHGHPTTILFSNAPHIPCAFAPKDVKCGPLASFQFKGGNYGNRTA